jgi:hypothetical protein
MEGFLINLDRQFDKIIAEKNSEKRKLFLASEYAASSNFAVNERTGEAKQKRIERAENDFFYFDKQYFPPEVHEDYAAPGKFHEEITGLMELQDKLAHILIKPRDAGSTSNFIKKLIQIILYGKRNQIGLGSESLDPAKYRILDIIYFLENSPRIQNDFEITFLQKSKDQLFIRTNKNSKGIFVDALSMERTSRGRARTFQRYGLIFITDWENIKSPSSKESRADRIKMLNEMRGSLSKKGTLIAEGNNFDVDTAQNDLLLERDKGVLNEDFVIHHYKAWDENRLGRYKSFWYSRYPAHSEKEMQRLMGMNDPYDWKGNGQGEPILKSAHVFPAEFYQEFEWESLPRDLVGAIYTDQNLSKKSKGDTTALAGLFFSPTTKKLYILFPKCKSYSKSNELLKDYLWCVNSCNNLGSIQIYGMDGNVSQESSWTNHIDNFEAIEDVMFPFISFFRLTVDDISTPASNEWKESSFMFPPGFNNTEEGREFTKQLFRFVSKKENKKDDAADLLICLYHILLTEGIADYLYNKRHRFEHHSVSKRNLTKIF